MLLADASRSSCSSRALSCWPRCSTGAPRSARERPTASRRDSTARPRSRLTHALRPQRPGRRRTVQVVYIDARLPDGGGLVLFGIGGGGGSPAAWSTRSRARRRRATGADRFHKQEPTALRSAPRPNPQDAAAWADARPRALPARRRRRRTSTRTRARSPPKGKAELAEAGDAWEQLPRAEPEEARRRASQPDGPGLHALNEPDKAVDAQEIITEARPDGQRPSPARHPRLPGRPDPQGRPRREKALELTAEGHAPGAQGPARRRPSSRPRSAAQQQPQPTATPAAELAPSLHCAAQRPCSSTGRAADS